MENFIQQLGQRAHITPEQAKSTVQFLAEYFKKNLPAPVAEQIETLLSGNTVATLAATPLAAAVSAIAGQSTAPAVVAEALAAVPTA